jgi:stringent starvation protein B
MAETPTKPYLIRAIHEWCSDSGYTPYIAVVADGNVNVPREFVKNGEIVLNISPLATNRLSLGNEFIEFQARFGGVARDVSVPVDKVIAIYARENGQGMAFDLPGVAAAPAGVPAASDRPADTMPAPGVAPVALVPVGKAGVPSAQGDGPVEPPPPPRAGDRPKLTRVK